MRESCGKETALGGVAVEYREERCISVSLRCPFGGPKALRSGIRDHRIIHRRDRSAKGGERHVTRRAGRISEGRGVPVVIHKLAERFYRPISSLLKSCRLTCQNRGLKSVPPYSWSSFDD